MKTAIRVTSIEEIRAYWNEDNHEIIIGSLLRLYANQEADEQQVNNTIHQNGIGFNHVDSGFLTNICKFYTARSYLTDKQLAFVKKAIWKYAKQLVGELVYPMPIKKAGVQEKAKQEKTAITNGELIEIKFPYDPKMVAGVKTLAGRRWNAEKKMWTCPITLENLDHLKLWEFNLSDDLEKILNRPKKEPVVIKHIKGFQSKKGDKPFPYQLKGIEFLVNNEGKGLIGDEMGLGKTIQALGFIHYTKDYPAIIICPASLKLNWAKEVKNWMPGTSFTVLSRRKNTLVNKTDIYIINYDIVEANMDFLKSINAKTLVLDEAHYTKNSKAKRTKAVKSLTKKIKNIIPLTGTPIINRPVEFFNVLNMIDPLKWSSFWKYAHRYCGAKNNGFGWDFTGASNTNELNEEVQSVMIRRLKSEVLPELPAKIRTVIPLELTNKKEYKKASNDLLRWIADKEGADKAEKAGQAEQLVRIEKLQQLVVAGKMKAAIEWIEDFLESDQKLVVFCTHKETINILFKHFFENGYYPVMLDGRHSQEERQQAVDVFQNDPNCKLFIGNIKAAGVGITLTAASSTCFIELGKTPGEHDQAEDRVHRIGQKAGSVSAYYLLAEDTIEIEIADLLDRKRKILDAVLDGKESADIGLLTELLKRMKNKGE